MDLKLQTVAIEMTAKEAEDLRIELLEVFKYWVDAINDAGGNADENWLLNDYPQICNLSKALRIRLPLPGSDLPF